VFDSTSSRGEIWFDDNWSTTGGRVQVATLSNVITSTIFTNLALTNTDFLVYDSTLGPAGIAGSPINLSLTNPEDHIGPVTATITGVPSGWGFNEGAANGDGSWTVQTNDLSALTV